MNVSSQSSSGSVHTAELGGQVSIELLSSETNHYVVKATGFSQTYFTFTIPKTQAEVSGVFDHETVCNWLLSKIDNATNGTNRTAAPNDVSFSLDSSEDDIYVFDVSGDIQADENSKVDGVYNLTINQLGDVEFTINVDASEIDDANGNLDWGDLLRWILEKLKKYLCPECL